MSLGQSFNAIEFGLERLLLEIRQEAIKLTASGHTPQITSANYHDFWNKLDGYQERLRGLVTALERSQDHIANRQFLARGLRGDARYRAQQSVRSHQERRHKLVDLAKEVQEALYAIYFRGQDPTAGDLMKGIDKLGKQLEKITQTIKQTDAPGMHSLQVTANSLELQLRSASPMTDTAPLSIYLTFITLMIGLYKRLRESRAHEKLDG